VKVRSGSRCWGGGNFLHLDDVDRLSGQQINGEQMTNQSIIEDCDSFR